MSLLEKIVDAALETTPDYTALRPAIEKEILHHDILREMNKAGYLAKLTFIGGTCLRSCYGSERLSEDLDFSGGFDFKRQDMTALGTRLKETLESKYSLPVSVSEPEKETGNTDTWKIKIVTSPERPNLPVQRINIDICALPSYNRKPVMLKNYYSIESGTTGLILYAETLTEILADKVIAIAFRPNRVKNRDLWDLAWLSQRNTTLHRDLLEKKLNDRKITMPDFFSAYTQRVESLKNEQAAFLREMRRFLSPAAFTPELTAPIWWAHLLTLLQDIVE
jgi:predicted nucleotidyltransferase component of viral defense system